MGASLYLGSVRGQKNSNTKLYHIWQPTLLKGRQVRQKILNFHMGPRSTRQSLFCFITYLAIKYLLPVNWVIRKWSCPLKILMKSTLYSIQMQCVNQGNQMGTLRGKGNCQELKSVPLRIAKYTRSFRPKNSS